MFEKFEHLMNIFHFKDTVRCYCETSNGGLVENGIVCVLNETAIKIGSCNSDEWCTGNPTDRYSTRVSQFCEKGRYIDITLIFNFIEFFLCCSEC